MHAGYYSGLFGPGHSHLLAIEKEINSVILENPKIKQIYFTGHSMGGAIASIVGLELLAGRVLGKFMNTSMLNVQFFVGENIYTKLSRTLGKEVRVLWDKSNFKNSYSAKIFYIDSAVNKDRAGLNIKAKLEKISEDDPIKPGIFVEVVIQGLAIPNSFLIDENSIYEDTFIYILKNNKPIKTKIKIEGFSKEKVIITGENLNNKNIILSRITNLNLYKKIISAN